MEASGAVAHPEGGGPPQSPAPVGSLVNRDISARGNRNPVCSMEVYRRGVRLVRVVSGMPFHGVKRRGIYLFSAKSKRNLKWIAANADPPLITTFAATYHQRLVTGREFKRDQKAFLDAYRREWGNPGYLWLLEFQIRNYPHGHYYIPLSFDTPGLREWVGDTWHRIAEPDSIEHLWWHRDRMDEYGNYNVRKWDMGAGNYLCGYLDKEHQKRVPEGFTGVGRFWGGSRNLVPEPIEIDVDASGGEKVWIPLVRTICRHHEKSLRKSKWKSRARRAATSYRLQNGAVVARRLLQEQGGE